MQEIPEFTDTNNLYLFYYAIKAVHGPVCSSVSRDRHADGTALIKDNAGIFARWSEHFSELLN